MPQCCHSPLSLAGDSIRLLRLKPAKDKSADIHCELFEYALPDSSTRHLYEALSYVWGSSEKRLCIFMDSCSIDVTDNLHAALLELRNHTMERTIWVDAICIDQRNQKEKEYQIRIMAKIYSQANLVIVWLGEAAEFSDQALEQILAAGRDTSTRSSSNNADQEQTMALLRRPWFRRIWVLQEVAAARSILITCGSAEIDGHAFCLGVEPLMRSCNAPLDLQRLIYSVTYLIRKAIFRPRRLRWVSSEVCPLSELIDMYHTHEATLHSDKVYALMGMSSDGFLKTGLSPDYDVPWTVLFERLVRHTLGEDMSVNALPASESVKIDGGGYILGRISSIQAGTTRNGRQIVTWERSRGATMITENWSSHWELQPSAKQIMEGDAICLFQGASRPTIIRFNEDYGAVILITVTPPQTIQARSEDIRWSGCLQNNDRLCPRNLRCIWDWSKLRGETLNQGDDKDVRSCFELIKETWNSALVFGDLEDYEQGERKFHEAMKYYEMASQEQGLIEFQTSQLPFTNSVDLDLMNKYYAQPPLLCAAERGYTSVVQLFIARFNVDISFKDTAGRTAIQLAAEKGHLAVVERLLQQNADVNAGDYGGTTALQAAAGGGHLAVVERLLQENADVNAAAGEDGGRTALQAAAGGGYLAVVERLLQKNADVNAAAGEDGGRTALQAAAEGGHLAVVERLLQENADVNAAAGEHRGTTALQAAAGGGHLAIVELLESFKSLQRSFEHQPSTLEPDV